MSRYLISVFAVLLWSSPGVGAEQTEPKSNVLDANAPVKASASENSPPGQRKSFAQRVPRHTLKPVEKVIKPLRAGDQPWYMNGLVGLSLVLLLIGVVAWAFKRFLPQSRITGGQAIEVLSKTYLSSKQSLALVKVGNRAMLIGITPEQISSLGEIDDPAEIAALMTRVKPKKSASKEFVNVLDRTAGLFQSKQAAEEPISEADDHTAYGHTNQSLQDLVKRIRTLIKTAHAG